jgi:NAD(P)-dependent dehydrogenase (short-subunit alcohol dehydrogenase family)
MAPIGDRPAILVTGGNSGIGLECARRLALEGAPLVLASRNEALSSEVAERLGAETGNDAIAALALDLGSLADVRRFAQEIDARGIRLRALVLNAGLQANDGPHHSADGHERTFAVNHLGHFLLANLLLRNLVSHAPARILVVSSGVHDPALRTGMPKPDIPDFESLASHGGPVDRFNGRLAYVNSKLCNLWFTYELVRRLESAGLADRPISVNAFEPGLVPGTGLAREYAAPLKFVWDHFPVWLSRRIPMMNTVQDSGTALAERILDPALERTSGSYFPSHTAFRVAPSSDESYDEARAAGLWEWSVHLTGLTAADSPLTGQG